ncbi:hypothetical protein ACLOJK_024618 [Asimina triloba]
MEDDEDEFGDLYTDVLRPSSSSSQSAPPFSQNSHFPPDDDDGGGGDILYDPNHRAPNRSLPSSHSNPPTSALAASSAAPQQLPIQRSPLAHEDAPRVSNSPISGSSPDVRIRVSGQSDAGGRPSTSVAEQEKAAVGVSETAPVDLVLGRDGGSGAPAPELDAGIGDLDADAVIPGLSTGPPGIPGISQGGAGNGDVGDSRRKEDGADGGGDEDWESDDSEDDIRIVLNENSGLMGMERNEDEDEDGVDLVIVADGDHSRPETEDQDWGEEAGQAVADGERKEAGDVAKANGGVMLPGGVGARIGYSGHGYHPHHSQFKYVRPGAASAAFGGGASVPIRPPVTLNLAAGRGRGDWRPMGINKGVPTVQKPFTSGFGFSGWTGNPSGRSGFEFTLPSHNFLKVISMSKEDMLGFRSMRLVNLVPMSWMLLEHVDNLVKIKYFFSWTTPCVSLPIALETKRDIFVRPFLHIQGGKQGHQAEMIYLPVDWAQACELGVYGFNVADLTSYISRTVFDIDIDSFEEKPWKHPGVDTSDYFNFGLDEDSWKEYCKQLDLLRLESTMQSKIRVYEGGRSEQDYDPDLPPELAAAAGLHDATAENAAPGKTDGSLTDMAGPGRGANRMRPPLPTGRAIQVEGGSGERLPSIDTRQPRLRDSDAIIEKPHRILTKILSVQIVLQDSFDDDSVTSNGNVDRPEDVQQGEDPQGGRDVEENDRLPDPEYFDSFPPAYNGRKREISRAAPFMGSVHSNMQEGDGILPFPSEAPLQYHPGSKARSMYPGGPFGASQGGRCPPGASRERYSQASGEHKDKDTPSHSTRNRFDARQKAKSGDDIEGKPTPEALSPTSVEAATDQSPEEKDDMPDEERLALADSIEGEEMGSDMGIPSETLADDDMLHTVKKQKLSSRVEQPAAIDVGNGDDLRNTQSDNSKAKSGSSRDYQKRQDGGEEEVVQDRRSRRTVETKRRHDEDESMYRRRDDYNRGSRHEADRSRMITKGREDLYHAYPHRDWDSGGSSHYARAKADNIERVKERDISVGTWQRRDEDVHSRRMKEDDIRRRERVEDSGSRHRKLHENERIDKDDHLHSRKRSDDVDWRSRHDRDGGPRQRERDDVMIGRHESLNDPHKRSKEEEFQRREHVDKEDLLHGLRAKEDTSRRKRERDDGMDQRRREDQVRARDKPDDHHSSRHRDESWRQRERQDRQRLKQPHEDTQLKREKDESRGAVRSGRTSDDKQWSGNPRVKDESKGVGSEKEYQLKDKRRQSEQSKRRDRVEEESSSQHRGLEDVHANENQSSNEDRNPRHERSSSRNDRPGSASDSQRVYKERHKDNARKSKELEGGDHSTLIPSKRKHDDPGSYRNEKVGTKSTGEHGSGNMSMTGHPDSRDRSQSRSSSAAAAPQKSHHRHHEDHEAQHQSSRKHGEDATSDDEQQSNSARGRSKLERWASHKERDIDTSVVSPISLLKGKDTVGRNHNNKSLPSEGTDGPVKTSSLVDNQHPSGGEENAGDFASKDTNMAVAASADTQHANTEKVGDDRHLDTVAKLKKRSERFKLPMPSEKDNATSKRAENEAVLGSAEAASNTEIKQERPARKRRWFWLAAIDLLHSKQGKNLGVVGASHAAPMVVYFPGGRLCIMQGMLGNLFFKCHASGPRDVLLNREGGSAVATTEAAAAARTDLEASFLNAINELGLFDRIFPFTAVLCSGSLLTGAD